MPYTPLQLGPHVPQELVDVVRSSVDPLLEEFHFLLPQRMPNQGPQGSLQRTLTLLVSALADAAAQTFQPGGEYSGERFKEFMRRHYPWDLDPPDGLTLEEAIDFLWDAVRAPLVHRFGLRAKNGDPRTVKFGVLLQNDDAGVTRLETMLDERPHSVAAVRRDQNRTIVWVEPFYWGIRIAITRALATPELCASVCEWLLSGDFDPLAVKAKKAAAKAKKATPKGKNP